jgi:hypothetical protein
MVAWLPWALLCVKALSIFMLRLAYKQCGDYHTREGHNGYATYRIT